MASSNRQLNQDQAYELAASLGASIDELIDEGKYDLNSVDTSKDIYWHGAFSGLPNSSVVARIEVGTNVKTLKVTAVVGKAQYIYTKEYAT
jgi:hypothetical protein